MNPDNDRFRRKLGVDVWHKRGYTGSRVVAASGEEETTDKTEHGWLSAEAFREIAPDARLVHLPAHGVVDEHIFDKAAAGIREHGVNVWWVSEAANVPPECIDETVRPLTKSCVFLCAAGNTNAQKKPSGMMESAYVYGVSACKLNAMTDRAEMEPYNFKSEFVDFLSFDGLWCGNTRFTGTSCAAPVLAGLAALLQDAAIDKIGRPLTATEVYDVFSTYFISVKNMDDYCWWGLVALPDPDDISWYDYADDQTAKKEKAVEPTGRIIEHNWNWAWTLTKRNTTDTIVLHHAAADSAPPEQIDAAHKANGWSGIGYHYYIRKNGEIHRGRPENTMGAQVENHNNHTIGICFEGNYETTTVMPQAQLEAGQWLVADVRARYAGASIKKHSDLMATQCPGKYFPFDRITRPAAADAKKEEKHLTEKEVKELFEKLWNEKLNNSAAAPSWAASDPAWSRARLLGVTDGSRPNAPCTRCEAAVMIMRAIDKGGK